MAVLVACGGGDLLLPAAGEPARIEIVQGDGQAASVGTALAEPVVALVSDGQGRPVVGVPVAFAFDDGSDATVAPDTMVTGSDGEAAFQVMMGTRVGAVGAEVRVSPGGGSGVLSASVSLTALSADANVLTEVSGDQQRASVGAPLPEPLVVRVTDGFGNPIAGVTITWTADAGGTLSDETTVTGPDGSASVERTLGPGAGTQHTLASAGGLSGSPVTFTHTAMAGAAAVLELVSGDGQSALAGTALPDPLVVRAHDADGNPVADLPVTWVVGEGGGGLAPATSATDADGRASTRWTLGPSAGRNTATAVISGVGTVGFTATGDPGAPPGLTLEVQPSESAVRGVVLAVQPVVQLREPDGSVRRKAGVNVTVSLVPGGATIRGTLTRATNAEGRAEFHDLALQGPPGSYALAFSATNYTGVTSHSIGLARAGTTTAIVSDEPDPSAPGVPVRVRFRVQSPGGVPDGTVRVDSDDGATCSATVAAGECSLVPVSTGARTLTATYAGGAEFEGSSDAESHLVEALAPTGTTTRITADDPDPSDVGQTVTVRFTVTAASGTPTGTVTVTASGGAETCAAGIGDGSCSLTLTAPGERTLTATYAGEGGFAGSSDSDRHTVRVPAPPPAAPSATASSVDVKDASIEINRNTDVKVVVRDANGREIEGVPVVSVRHGRRQHDLPTIGHHQQEGGGQIQLPLCRGGDQGAHGRRGGSHHRRAADRDGRDGAGTVGAVDSHAAVGHGPVGEPLRSATGARAPHRDRLGAGIPGGSDRGRAGLRRWNALRYAHATDRQEGPRVVERSPHRRAAGQLHHSIHRRRLHGGRVRADHARVARNQDGDRFRCTGSLARGRAGDRGIPCGCARRLADGKRHGVE